MCVDPYWFGVGQSEMRGNAVGRNIRSGRLVTCWFGEPRGDGKSGFGYSVVASFRVCLLYFLPIYT